MFVAANLICHNKSDGIDRNGKLGRRERVNGAAEKWQAARNDGKTEMLSCKGD